LKEEALGVEAKPVSVAWSRDVLPSLLFPSQVSALHLFILSAYEKETIKWRMYMITSYPFTSLEVMKEGACLITPFEINFAPTFP
jgi:hypothetical protein